RSTRSGLFTRHWDGHENLAPSRFLVGSYSLLLPGIELIDHLVHRRQEIADGLLLGHACGLVLVRRELPDNVTDEAHFILLADRLHGPVDLGRWLLGKRVLERPPCRFRQRGAAVLRGVRRSSGSALGRTTPPPHISGVFFGKWHA